MLTTKQTSSKEMLNSPILAACLCFLLFGHDGAHALTAISTKNHKNIQVTPVQSPRDMIELGNLRYSEWMLEEPPETRPSRMAFRMATAETQQERMAQNAVTFLSRSDDVVVGTAEVSPIEVKDCYSENEDCRYLYVTDVVTARTHRRQGIAATLMDAIERHAWKDQVSTVFLLHVEHDNTAALGFYQALGYKIVEKTLEGLDVDRLSENAGVSGQLLLSKTLQEVQNESSAAAKKTSKKKASRTAGGGGKGFGN